MSALDAMRWSDAAPYWAKGKTLHLRTDVVAEFTTLALCQRAAWALNAQFERTQQQFSTQQTQQQAEATDGGEEN